MRSLEYKSKKIFCSTLSVLLYAPVAITCHTLNFFFLNKKKKLDTSHAIISRVEDGTLADDFRSKIFYLSQSKIILKTTNMPTMIFLFYLMRNSTWRTQLAIFIIFTVDSLTNSMSLETQINFYRRVVKFLVVVDFFWVY